MRRTAIAAAAVAATVAIGSCAPAQAYTSGNFCDRLASLAGQIMDRRQQGMHMEQLMRRLPRRQEYRTMIIAAYDQRQYMTRERRERAIQHFKNEARIGCQQGRRLR